MSEPIVLQSDCCSLLTYIMLQALSSILALRHMCRKRCFALCVLGRVPIISTQSGDLCLEKSRLVFSEFCIPRCSSRKVWYSGEVSQQCMTLVMWVAGWESVLSPISYCSIRHGLDSQVALSQWSALRQGTVKLKCMREMVSRTGSIASRQVSTSGPIRL